MQRTASDCPNVMTVALTEWIEICQSHAIMAKWNLWMKSIRILFLRMQEDVN